MIHRVWRKIKTHRKQRPLPAVSELKAIHQANLNRLQAVPRWIDEDVYRQSIFRYGIPESVFGLLNKTMGDEPTYTDLLLYFAGQLRSPIHYLELGVSVGKNFFQLCHGLEKAWMVGLDIEALNPVLDRHLGGAVQARQWETPATSLKKSPSQVLTFPHFSQNTVSYISGDIWDEQLWRQLQGQPFNVIFSDALHLPGALLFEYEMIREYHLLLKEEFVWLWDDLGGLMTDAFLKIAADLKGRSKLPQASVDLYRIRGWLGNHEKYHLVGAIRNGVPK